jgi:hypothetical protein
MRADAAVEHRSLFDTTEALTPALSHRERGFLTTFKLP